MTKILVSNDDGVHAIGIEVLSKALSTLGEVMTVGPDRNCSGASQSLTLLNPLRIQTLENGFISVNGTPTDSVHLALRQLCNPEIVVSGINAGENMGDDVLYSGTVAAAMEGRFLGLPAIAISLAGSVHYSAAAQVACDLVTKLMSTPLQGMEILNVNVPDLPYEEIKGMKITRLGARHKAEDMIRSTDPFGRDIYWLGPAGKEQDASDGTDFDAIRQGYVSITPLKVDMTAHHRLNELKEWIS